MTTSSPTTASLSTFRFFKSLGLIADLGKSVLQAVNKRIALFVVLFGGTVLFAGCAGFWDAPSSSGTTSTSLSSGYFYLLDQSTYQVISYYIDSGTLTLVSTVALPSEPIAITIAPNDEFLYVSTLSGVYLYTISYGVLTLSNSSQAITSDPAVAMQVDSTNTWLVETSGQGVLNAIPIVSSTGLLNDSSGICTHSSIVCSVSLAGATIHQLVIAPNNKFVFVAAATNGTEAFSFSAGESNPFGSVAYATVSPITATTGSALSVAVDPSNRLLYVGEANAGTSSSGGLRSFTLSSTGALTEISGSPHASGGTSPYAILPKSTNDYVYVANWSGTSTGNITGFSVSDSNSSFSLTKINSSVGTGVKPMSLVEDSDHNFVLAVSAGGDPYFDAYFFDTSTAGQLDKTITSSTYSGIAIAANYQ